MRIPASKIELAASQEESRYTLKAIQLDVETKRFVATDGFIAAVIPAELSPEDHSGLISLDTIKALRNMQKTSKNVPVDVHTNGKVCAEANGVKLEHEYVPGQYPRIDMVKPKFEGPATISLDVALLMRLAQALTDSATSKKAVVSLWVKDANSAVGVKVSDNEEAWGAIMPTRP